MPETDVRRPDALWFGHGSARCFGMVHAPATESHRGVIFCNALAFEGALDQRPFRLLAQDLTARGFWCLRFDYHGEGDSAGGSWEPARLDAWLESLDAAVDLLRARGVLDIRLVGFRMGASIAHLYSIGKPGISATVLWAPCVRGAAYVRELRALSKLSAAARPVQHVRADRFPDDSLEVVGFEFTAETQHALAGLDLVAAPRPAHPRAALVIDRTDAPPSDDLVQVLLDAGSKVDHERMSGYEAFVTDDESSSVLPEAVLGRITEWLDDDARDTETSAVSRAEVCETRALVTDDATAARPTPGGPAADDVIEQPVWIDDRFYAVISRPAGRAPRRRTAIVLCNTGATNRVGPGRLYVTLARYWASMGFTAVRVDLGGTGDSIGADPATENRPLAPVRIEELRDVVSWARRSPDYERVVVFGVCSGAYNAFQAAVRGMPVDNLMLVNPGVFYLGDDQRLWTSEEAAVNSANTLSRGATNIRKWKVALHDREARAHAVRRARQLFGRNALAGYRVLTVAGLRNAARRLGLRVEASTALARDLDDMIARGVRLLMVFAAGESTGRYLRTVGGPDVEALVHRGGLEVVDIDGGDHIFSPPGARQRLVELTTSYLERELTAARSPAEKKTGVPSTYGADLWTSN